MVLTRTMLFVFFRSFLVVYLCVYIVGFSPEDASKFQFANVRDFLH